MIPDSRGRECEGSGHRYASISARPDMPTPIDIPNARRYDECVPGQGAVTSIRVRISTDEEEPLDRDLSVASRSLAGGSLRPHLFSVQVGRQTPSAPSADAPGAGYLPAAP